MEKILAPVTNTDQVRSVLGIDEKDLSDKVFDTASVELELTLALLADEIDYGLVVSEGEDTSPSADESKRYNYLKLYSIYTCATIIIPRLRLAATQKVSDGDNTMERFLNPEFEKLEEAYRSKVETYRVNLRDAISGSTTEDVTVSQFGGVAPTYDPVTGI